MHLFQTQGLEKTYFGAINNTEVLHGLTFTVDAGEFVSIMGPSGSGKSTLLHILGFLADHTGGEYHFNGRQFSDYADDEIAQVRNAEMGFVFQSFNLLPRQSVAENVRLPLLYSKRSETKWRERIETVIDIVGLTHRMDYETYKLSGGEKQRVAIARALVNEPRVIFADEPTGNLDSETGQAILQTLQHLHETLGHTVILITHEQFTAEHADRMITLVDGRIENDTNVAHKRHATDGFKK